jgi:hypothetical protein
MIDFTNYIGESNQCLREAAEQAFGLHEYVRMSGNSGTQLFNELGKACEDFKAELVKRNDWERFTERMGMSDF